MVGSGSADLWIASSETDTDLQVTLTEVRPDGKETYVQSGWLRASKRALDEERSTELQPLHHPAGGRRRADLPDGRVHPGAGGDLPVRPRLPGRAARSA